MAGGRGFRELDLSAPFQGSAMMPLMDVEAIESITAHQPNMRKPEMSIPAESIFEQTGRISHEAEMLRHEVSDLRHFMRNLSDIAELADGPDARRNLSSLVETVLWKILDSIEAEEGSLMLVDDATDELVYVAGVGNMRTDLLRGQRMPKTRGLAGWVVQNHTPTVMENQRSDRPHERASDKNPWTSSFTIVAAPLMAGGRVIGVVELFHRRRAPFSPERLEMLSLACRFAGELLNTLETRRDCPPEAY